MHRRRAAADEQSTVRRGTPSRKRSHHCSDRGRLLEKWHQMHPRRPAENHGSTPTKPPGQLLS
eukprot:5742123-Pyramimonas_sp.AAC.1